MYKKKFVAANETRNQSATDRTYVITECRNKEGFFLEITEVLWEVRRNYSFSHFSIVFPKYAEILDNFFHFFFSFFPHCVVYRLGEGKVFYLESLPTLYF